MTTGPAADAAPPAPVARGPAVAGPLRPPVGTVRAVLRLARPKFLFQSLLVAGLGVTVAVHATGTFALGGYLLTVAFAWVTHLMTHFSNDYFDLEADRANPAPTTWTGGSRVLVDGLLPPVAGLATAFGLLFTGVALIALMPTLPARLTAVAIATLAWFYTAPPGRLNYRALGEVCCALVLYTLGPVLATLLQSGPVDGVLLACVGAVGALQTARCLVMNLCDLEGDRLVGKRTLAGVLGPRRTVRAYVLVQVTVHLAVVALALAGRLPVLVAAALCLVAPVPWRVAGMLRAGAVRAGRAEAVAFWSSVQMPFVSAALTLGLLLDLWTRGRPAPATWTGLACGALTLFALWLGHTLHRTHRRRAAGPAPPGVTAGA